MKTQLVSTGKRLGGHARWRLALACLVLLALAVMPSRAHGGGAQANAALQAPLGAPAGLASSLSASATSDPLAFVEALFDDTDLDGAISVAVSPDGNSVYVASHFASALLALHRDKETGALTLVDVERDDVDGVDGLSGVMAVAVSPYGDHVYTASAGDNAVAVFGRNKGTGTLSYVEVQKDGVYGVDGLLWAWSVAVSPDGRNVYVAGNLDSAVALFHRNETSGALTYGGVFKDSDPGVDGLAGASSVTVSPDGRHVYVAGSLDNAVAVFSRSAGSGWLTYAGMVEDGVGGVDGLGGAFSVALSRDGRHVYVASVVEDAVAVFSRNATSGALTYVETEWDNAGGVDGLDNPQSVVVSPDGDHVYVAGGSDDAVAVFSRDGTSGTLTFVEAKWDGAGGVDGLDHPRSVAVSPDGDHVYVASYDDDAVTIFARGEIGDGTTYLGVIKYSDPGVEGLLNPESIAVSPDGEHIYVASYDDAVAVFNRDETTGALTFVQSQKDGVDGVDGLLGAWSVAVSPDGDHVYVAGRDDDAVAVFSRNKTSGALTFIEAKKDGVGGVDGLDGATSVALSLDGRHVYVAGRRDDAVAIFNRNQVTGALFYAGMVQDGVGGVDGLWCAHTVTVSPDGDHVYVASNEDDAVAIFSRVETTGALIYVGMVQDGVGGVDGLDFAHSVAVSPDGEHVYVTGHSDEAVAIFSRNQATGELSYVGMVKDGVGGVDGLDGAWSVAVSPDGHHVYVTGYYDYAVAIFNRSVTTGALIYAGMVEDGVGGVDGLSGARSVAVSPDGHHVYVASIWDDAVAIFGRQARADPLTYAQTAWSIDGLDNPQSVAVSPDGLHVYTAAIDDDAVVAFRRDATTGALSYIEMEKDGVGGVNDMNGVRAVAVSPDGTHVYAAGYYDDAVSVFERSVITGGLTYLGMIKDGVGPVNGMNGPISLAISPDGDYVYVAGYDDDAVVAFERERFSGWLTYLGMQQDDSQGGGIGALGGPYAVTVSPDSNHIYVACYEDNSVVTFRADESAGGLVYVDSDVNGVGGVNGLAGARSVAVSPDGGHVYVAGVNDDSVAMFSRNGTTGALTYIGRKWDDVSGVDGLDGAQSVAVSPDGGRVYVVGQIDHAVAVFDRNGNTGALTYLGMREDGVDGVDGLYGAWGLAVSPDGTHVYVSSTLDNAVAVFEARYWVFLPLVLRNH